MTRGLVAFGNQKEASLRGSQLCRGVKMASATSAVSKILRATGTPTGRAKVPCEPSGKGIHASSAEPDKDLQGSHGTSASWESK